MNTYADTKQEILNSRGSFCECGCGELGHDLHHALIHNIRKKGKTKYPQLNDPRNLVLVNHWEHVELKKFDTPAWRRYFWKLQVERYGIEDMMEWVNSLPAKLSHRLDFIERN